MNLPQPMSVASLNVFARAIAVRLRCGDVVTLAGPLGAGKTTFAQCLIPALSPAPVEVTSPTFGLLQSYPVVLADGTACELSHYDLYRVDHPSALIELGLDDALAGVTLIEWPERLQGYQMPVALAVSFSLTEDGGHRVAFTAHDRRFEDL